jgi:hypothetical protein
MRKIDQLLNEIAFDIHEINHVNDLKCSQVEKLLKVISNYLDINTIDDLDDYKFKTILNDLIQITYIRYKTKANWEIIVNNKKVGTI